MKKDQRLKQFWKIENLKSRAYNNTLYSSIEEAFDIAPMNSLIRKVWAVEL